MGLHYTDAVFNIRATELEAEEDAGVTPQYNKRSWN
jgi:hypothetical protein